MPSYPFSPPTARCAAECICRPSASFSRTISHHEPPFSQTLHCWALISTAPLGTLEPGPGPSLFLYLALSRVHLGSVAADSLRCRLGFPTPLPLSVCLSLSRIARCHLCAPPSSIPLPRTARTEPTIRPLGHQDTFSWVRVCCLVLRMEVQLLNLCLSAQPRPHRRNSARAHRASLLHR